MNDQVNEEVKPKGECSEIERRERDLNADIAEKIMGWTGFTCRRRIGYPRDADPARVLPSVVPEYATDIAAAMQVVERLYAAEWAVEIHRSIVIDDDWSVQLSRIGRNGSVESVAHVSKTLPEAICRAALKATECLSILAPGTNGPAS